MVATGGGTVSLILGEFKPLRFALAGLGFLSTLALGIVSWRFYTRIGALIAQIKEDQLTGMEWAAFGLAAATMAVIVVTLWRMSTH